MSKAQHTSWPWEVTGVGASGKAVLVEHEDGMIEVYGANKEQNACLIAAAPELLDALKTVQALLFMRTDAKDGEAMQALAKARAAITKAKGK